MKLIHPIIITQIILLHLHTAFSSASSPTSPQQQTTLSASSEQETATTITSGEQEDDNYFEVSQESRKIIIEQAKASLLKVLGLKEVPKQRGAKNKAVVPFAMFEEYKNLRESVREYIPDDRDFYGKINVHELEKRHVDYWSNSKYPGIEIDMDSADDDDGHSGYSGGSKKFLYKGDYERLSFFKPQGEPEDVPHKFEHLLPPHNLAGGGADSRKPISSVHLRFNLSQELLNNPIKVDELQAAELHLTREKIVDYSEQKQSKIKKETASTNIKDTSSGEQHKIINDKQEQEEPVNISDRKNIYYTTSTTTTTSSRYQRLYLLHVLGYDKHNEPITRIHDSQILDTHQSTPLMFDIYLIVKRWITNPADNYGIIVRITNEQQPKQLDKTTSTQQQDDNSKTTTTATNASTTPTVTLPENSSHNGDNSQDTIIMDHVRLKREFRSASEIDELWYQKQPSIYVFSSPPESARRHVKRNIGTHHNNNPTGSSGSGRSRTKGSNQKKAARTVEKCSRKSLQINFDEVGWSSWIIAPANYLANYCLGDCSYPMNDIQNATNHAIIQSIFHSVGRVVPKSCCAPIKLSTMAILYQLDGAVQMRHYDDMVVESCGCV